MVALGIFDAVMAIRSHTHSSCHNRFHWRFFKALCEGVQQAVQCSLKIDTTCAGAARRGRHRRHRLRQKRSSVELLDKNEKYCQGDLARTSTNKSGATELELPFDLNEGWTWALMEVGSPPARSS